MSFGAITFGVPIESIPKFNLKNYIISTLKKKGLNCCSEQPISFHLVKATINYMLEYLIYHVRPYSVVRNSRIKLPSESELVARPSTQTPTTTSTTTATTTTVKVTTATQKQTNATTAATTAAHTNSTTAKAAANSPTTAKAADSTTATTLTAAVTNATTVTTQNQTTTAAAATTNTTKKWKWKHFG